MRMHQVLNVISGIGIVNDIWGYFLGTKKVPEPTRPVSRPNPKKLRKRSDRTRFTQYQYDFIVDAYRQFIEYNRTHPGARKTQLELVDILNQHLGLDKGRTAYFRVWSGRIDRDSLAKGTPIQEQHQ